ncbi:hypothetical protein BDV06DRAFT_228496 [Aspergillus oleicola]
MARWSRKDEDADGDNLDSTPGTPDTRQVQHNLADLSLSRDNSGTTDGGDTNTNSKEPLGKHQKQKPKDIPATEKEDDEDEDDSTFQPRPHRYKIHTLRQGSDEPDRSVPGEDDGEAGEAEESRDVDPDELLKHLFTFDAPREIDLKVKIKGDFNVTVLLD